MLDPVSAPKWRLDCNHCSFLIYLPKDLHSAKVSSKQTCEVLVEPVQAAFIELCHSLTAGRGLSAARQLCNCLTYAQDKLNFHHTCSRGMQCHVARCLRSTAGVALKWLPPAAGYKTYCHPVQSGASCPAFLHIQGVQPQAGLQLLSTGNHPAYLFVQECSSSLLVLDFKKGASPLPGGETHHVGCVVCSSLLQPLCEVRGTGRSSAVSCLRTRALWLRQWQPGAAWQPLAGTECVAAECRVEAVGSSPFGQHWYCPTAGLGSSSLC